jgi:hypothetical protein
MLEAVIPKVSHDLYIYSCLTDCQTLLPFRVLSGVLFANVAGIGTMKRQKVDM